MYTPYSFAANQPIHAVELEGLESSDDKNPTAGNRGKFNTNADQGTFIFNEETGEYYATDMDDGKRNVSSLTISDQGIEFIKKYEGFESKMYNDQAGNATIGYGHLVHYGKIGTDKTSEAEYLNGITKDQGTTLLKSDLVSYENTVKSVTTTKVSQSEYDALVMFQYNTGGLRGSSLIKRVNAGETATKITEGFMMWNKVTIGGKKVESTGLTNRRTDEAELFTTADYVRNH